MSGLRLGIISREWPVNRSGCGGIGTYFHNLATGLARCGTEPIVLTGPAEDSDSDAQKCRFPVIHLPEPKLGLSRRVADRIVGAGASYRVAIYNDIVRRRAALKRYLPRLVQDYGIEVLVGPLWAGELVDAAALTGLPVVLRGSGNLRRTLRANEDEPGRYDLRIHRLEQEAMASCAGLYSPSKSALRDLLGCLVAPLVPITVIPSGVDTEMFRPRPDAHSRRGCRFLFVGRLERQKGLRLLTSLIPPLLTRLEQAEVWLAGPDTPSAPNGTTWQEHLERSCPSRLLARCRFLGRLPWNQLPRLYNQCDVMWAPSVGDNQPNATLEAMASGLPVVASAVAGLDETIHRDENGIILQEAGPETWMDASLALARDDQQRRKMGRAARSRMVSEFNLETTARAVLELCRRAVDKQQDDPGESAREPAGMLISR